MTGYGLIATIVQSIASLAWPGVLFAIVWLFRKRLEALLPGLRAKFKNFEIFLPVPALLNQAEKEAEALPPSPDLSDYEDEPDYGDQPTTPEEEAAAQFERIAAISPQVAIAGLLRELVEFLKEMATEYGLDPRTGSSLNGLIGLLRRRKIIDKHTSALLMFLSAVNDAAAHGEYISKEDAMRYQNLAADLLRRIQAQVSFHRAGPISDQPVANDPRDEGGDATSL
jgi:hypothetical protein